MKQFITILIAFAASAVMAATAVSPLAGGIPDINAGVMQPALDTGPRWGKCVVTTRCFDSTCTNSMSAVPTSPGADPGGMVLQILDTRYCADRIASAQDTIYAWMLVDAGAAKWDSVFTWMANHSYVDSGYHLSILGGLTDADKKLMSQRVPLQGRIASPIKFEGAQCAACSQ